MKIKAEISTDEELNERGRYMPCTRATCTKCHHTTFSWGDGGASARRCLALLKSDCPFGENNFYSE